MFFLLTSMRKVFALAWVIKTLCALVSFFFFFHEVVFLVGWVWAKAKFIGSAV